jgi:hypothetical protein
MDIIKNQADMLEYLSAETVAQAEKNLYKATACGAWISFREGFVKVGSIVEGSHAECETHILSYPFTAENWEKAIAEIEEEADILWKEANEGDDE